MADGSLLDSIKKPPFANYDIVVYFGAGIFTVPFANRYLFEPTRAKWPNFDINIGSNFSKEAASVLSLLFFIYIIGHLLAFAASQIIEKSVDRFLGKTSSAIIISSISNARSRDDAIRAMIYHQASNIKNHNAIIASLFRAFFHIPALPFYFAMFTSGTFGYYDTRIPGTVMSVLRKKVDQTPEIGCKIGLKTKWYKPLEYYVINKYPLAVPRMYNYLVISGLFRSISLIFLISSWCVLCYGIYYCIYDEWLLKPLLGQKDGHMAIIEYFIMIFLYIFSLFSY